jgi:hypothetical protein
MLEGVRSPDNGRVTDVSERCMAGGVALTLVMH